jgi:hypothetical protein
MLKKVVGKQAKNHAQVVVNNSRKKEQTVIKEGVPLEESNKHLNNTSTPNVGVSLGITKNMGNYESLRIDTWVSSPVEQGETTQEAYNRVVEEVVEVLQDLTEELKEGFSEL